MSRPTVVNALSIDLRTCCCGEGDHDSSSDTSDIPRSRLATLTTPMPAACSTLTRFGFRGDPFMGAGAGGRPASNGSGEGAIVEVVQVRSENTRLATDACLRRSRDQLPIGDR